MSCVPGNTLRAGQVKFNPLSVPVRNPLEANKGSEGKRFAIFQVRLGG